MRHCSHDYRAPIAGTLLSVCNPAPTKYSPLLVLLECGSVSFGSEAAVIYLVQPSRSRVLSEVTGLGQGKVACAYPI